MLFVHLTELSQLHSLQSFECDEYEGLTRENIKMKF